MKKIVSTCVEELFEDLFDEDIDTAINSGKFITAITIYELNDNADPISSDSHDYVKISDTLADAVLISDMIKQSIEIDQLDNIPFAVDIYMLHKSRELIYVGTCTIWAPMITRTDVPSKYIVWGDKKPHIFSIDWDNSKINYKTFHHLDLVCSGENMPWDK